jgi:hypothetical protein
MMKAFMVFMAMVFALTQAALVTKAAANEKTQANPMRKIITMLQDMAKEIEREGEVETEIFDKALCACEGGEKGLQTSIDESTAAIAENSAALKSGTAQKAQLEQEVKDHAAAKTGAEEDLSSATMLRDKENAKFIAEETDGKTNLASIGKAIPAIEEGMGGASLMQLPRMNKLRRYVEVTKYLTSDARSGVLAFLDQGSEFSSSESVQAPQSGEILGILKSMKDEMEKDLKDLQAQEQSDFNGYQDLKSAKLTEIDLNEKAIISKDKRIGALALEISESKHALEDAEAELANAQKFLSNMKEECANKAKEKAMRAKMRSEEIKAISEAVGILNDDDALEVFSKAKAAALVQKVQVKTYDALLQVTQHRVTLRAHSTVHEEPVSTADAASEMVSKMVDGMVAVLHDSDVDDEHKKAWCVNETEISAGIEAEKKAFIEAKTSEISEQTDQVAALVEEIKGLIAKVNELDKMVHGMTEDRKSEHQEFVDSFATSATAIKLIGKAIQRLEKFYSPNKYAKEKKAVQEAAIKKAGLALVQPLAVQRRAASLLPGGFDSLIQTGSTSMSRFRKAVREGVDPVVLPETPGGAVEKSETGGVMALMNEFVTDLKLDMTESETEEKFNAKEYVRIMADAKETRAQDVKSMSGKKSEKATLEQKLVENKDQKALAEEELHNLQLYIVQLHTECDFLVQNFDIRHDDRVDEETGLEEAKTIVTEEEPPSYRAVEKRYEEEHTEEDVSENFPGTPIAER